MNEFETKDGYIGGSYTDIGYVAIVNGFECEVRKVFTEDGSVCSSVVYPIHSIMSGKRVIVHNTNSSGNHGYDTSSVDNSWHLVQFSRSAGLFDTEDDARVAVRKYIADANKNNKDANKEIYSYEDLNVEIKKVQFECSMKYI